MQLVLLLPENKPPFIGIKTYGADDGGKLNKDLILHHKNKPYKINLEWYNGVLNLMLICEPIVSVRFYNKLSHEPEQLRSWLYMVQSKKSPHVNFGHVNDLMGKMCIQLVDQTSIKWVLKVGKIELITK